MEWCNKILSLKAWSRERLDAGTCECNNLAMPCSLHGYEERSTRTAISPSQDISPAELVHAVLAPDSAV